MTNQDTKQTITTPTINYGLLSSEVDNLNLDLKMDLFFDNLAVFIRDSENPKQYWFRYLQIPFQTNPNDFTYEDSPMGEFNSTPCPEDQLEIAIRNMIGFQTMASESSDEEIKNIQAQVGIAEYVGKDILPMDIVIALTVAKYNKMRLKTVDVKQAGSA